MCSNPRVLIDDHVGPSASPPRVFVEALGDVIAMFKPVSQQLQRIPSSYGAGFCCSHHEGLIGIAQRRELDSVGFDEFCEVWTASDDDVVPQL